MPAKCNGKVAFDSFRQAAKQAVLSRHRHESPLSAYHCAFCGNYHVGSRDGHKKDSKKHPVYHREKSRNRLCLMDEDLEFN